MVQYTVLPVISLILSGNKVFFQFSFFLSASNLFLFISLLSQAPVDNGSKITSYLLEWDEVLLYIFFSTGKTLKGLLLLLSFRFFSFSKRASCLNCISTLMTPLWHQHCSHSLYLKIHIWLMSLHSSQTTAHCCHSCISHSSYDYSGFEKLNGFNDFM